MSLPVGVTHLRIVSTVHGAGNRLDHADRLAQGLRERIVGYAKYSADSLSMMIRSMSLNLYLRQASGIASARLFGSFSVNRNGCLKWASM